MHIVRACQKCTKLSPHIHLERQTLHIRLSFFCFHMLGESNYSLLATEQHVTKQSFVVHPKDTNIEQSLEQMQVLRSQQKWNELGRC